MKKDIEKKTNNDEFLLMSIKTKHANKIFSGTKTFEYRTKTINNKNLNKYCLIYSSEDEKAVIGYVVFDYIVDGNCDFLIKNTNPENIDGLKKYLSEKKVGYALHIKEYERFDKPIKLDVLKGKYKTFNVPQYYRYIKKDEYLYSIAKKIIKIHKMKLKHEFFNYIKYGEKRIEIRLYDEKRKIIKIGDEIEFTDLDTSDKLNVTVKNLYIFDSFEKLINEFNINVLADKKYNKLDLINILNTIYTEDNQNELGVIGIEFEINENI